MRDDLIKSSAYKKAEPHWILASEFNYDDLKAHGGSQGLSICGSVDSLNPFSLKAFKPSLNTTKLTLFKGLALNDLFKIKDKVLMQGYYNVDLKEFVVEKLDLLAPCLDEECSSISNSQQDKWSDFLQEIRSFFLNNNFKEHVTPNLVVCPGMEPNLEPFGTYWKNGQNSQSYFLPTSPELHLKKLLAEGHERIFELKPCFRNEELSEHHQPEFMMLEWYRAYRPLNAIEDDLKALVSFLSEKEIKFKKRSIKQLFKGYVNFDLSTETSLEELIKLAQSLKLHVTDSYTWDDVFHLIFIDFIEPHLGLECPEFIYDFPASQSALARLTKDGWSDRFELYWNGLEIANAFDELNDPKIQLNRFQKDLSIREELGKTLVPIDEDFMSSMQMGIPPSGGIAVGVERLFMALYNIKRINEVKSFSKS